MRSFRSARLWIALFCCASLFSAVALAADQKQPATVQPVPRADDWWQKRQQSFNDRIKQGHVDLILIGDSITHGWESGGKDVWEKFYAKRNAVNLGIGGDQTQHVLWRLDNGNIDGIKPKLAVLMIGTNNAGSNTPEEIAAGVKAIVEKLRTKLPQTKVLVLAIFPRGADSQDHLRQVNEKANKIIAKLANGKTVFYLDIGPKFLAADGTLSKDIMPDLLHPNTKGYTIWAEATEPTVAQLMGEKGSSNETRGVGRPGRRRLLRQP
jgi:lysophospholipase L1-like esterase